MKYSAYKTVAFALIACMAVAGCSDDDDDSGEVTEEVSFEFSTVAFGDYSRVDRMGMPAIATALIANKDDYNAADPVDDAAGDFVTEIVESLDFLHGALDDQLTDRGLTPCTVVGDGSGSCVGFAGDLIIPDTLKINTAADAAFPNGRLLTDPVIDVTLAVALLELTAEPAVHTAADLVGVLNPSANDNEFQTAFPFLASPNE